MEWDKVERLPVSAYRDLLEQTLNIACLLTQREFAFQSQREEQEQLRYEYEQLKEEGWFS